jgi:hypothetical protein
MLASRPPLVFAAAALASGAALVVAILASLSLGWTLAGVGITASGMMAVAWTRTTAVNRAWLAKRMRTGLWIGVVATVCYDVIRIVIVSALQLRLRPFETIPLFGRSILGSQADPAAAWAAGGVYHYLNGVTFAVSYCILLGGRDWKFGLIWALGLESFMLALYPGWLHLDRVLVQELTLVSISGHAAYGSSLGLLSQRLLRFRSLLAVHRIPAPRS